MSRKALRLGDYWTIDLAVVWRVIQRDLPVLKEQLDQLDPPNE